MNNVINNVIVLMPSYEPNENIVDLVKKLVNYFSYIVIINDGSSDDKESIFSDAISIDKNKVFLYRNVVNMGKGRAIKNGINYCFNAFKNEIDTSEIEGFITVDSDGQHSVEDIINCAKTFNSFKESLVLGTRKFDDDVPLRSKFGNETTINVMRLLYGLRISDTQTGLRAFSTHNAKSFLNLSGERYEFEIQMLIKTKKKNIPIVEVPIKTIYISENAGSHFNPVVDSFKIYKIIIYEFVKFAFSSLFSFFIDITLYSQFIRLFKGKTKYYIIFSAIIARIISSIVNYNINKNIVFEDNRSIKNTIFKYYLTAICVLAVSSLSTHLISSRLGGLEVPIKIIVDLLIFFIDFRVQKYFFNK